MPNFFKYTPCDMGLGNTIRSIHPLKAKISTHSDNASCLYNGPVMSLGAFRGIDSFHKAPFHIEGNICNKFLTR